MIAHSQIQLGPVRLAGRRGLLFGSAKQGIVSFGPNQNLKRENAWPVVLLCMRLGAKIVRWAKAPFYS
jgi:hypothetical protein